MGDLVLHQSCIAILFFMYLASALSLITLELPAFHSKQACENELPYYQAILNESVTIQAIIDAKSFVKLTSSATNKTDYPLCNTSNCTIKVHLGQATRTIAGNYQLIAEPYTMNSQLTTEVQQFIIDVGELQPWRWKSDAIVSVNETTLKAEVSSNLEGYPLPDIYRLRNSSGVVILESDQGVFSIDWKPVSGRTLLLEARGRFNQSINTTIQIPQLSAKSVSPVIASRVAGAVVGTVILILLMVAGTRLYITHNSKRSANLPLTSGTSAQSTSEQGFGLPLPLEHITENISERPSRNVCRIDRDVIIYVHAPTAGIAEVQRPLLENVCTADFTPSLPLESSDSCDFSSLPLNAAVGLMLAASVDDDAGSSNVRSLDRGSGLTLSSSSESVNRLSAILACPTEHYDDDIHMIEELKLTDNSL